ncbi:unnamed protein product [Discula destructiva]
MNHSSQSTNGSPSFVLDNSLSQNTPDTQDSIQNAHHRDNTNSQDEEAPASAPSSVLNTPLLSRRSSRSSTKMNAPPPFEVPKPWQEAMAIVSVNAGLRPREILMHYYEKQPLQKHQHPDHTEIDLASSKRASDRNIISIKIRYENDAPSKISSMIIFVDEVGPHLQDSPVARFVTNTSINHVLEKEPAANCPLWLRAHYDITHTTSPFQLIPCCDEWIEDLNFKRPLSKEEKQLPAVVDRLFQEVQRKENLLEQKEKDMEEKERALTEKEAELQERIEELVKVKVNNESAGQEVAVTAAEVDLPKSTVDFMLAEVLQHWQFIIILVVVLGGIACIR